MEKIDLNNVSDWFLKEAASVFAIGAEFYKEAQKASTDKKDTFNKNAVDCKAKLRLVQRQISHREKEASYAIEESDESGLFIRKYCPCCGYSKDLVSVSMDEFNRLKNSDAHLAYRLCGDDTIQDVLNPCAKFRGSGKSVKPETNRRMTEIAERLKKVDLESDTRITAIRPSDFVKKNHWASALGV